jgi:hypothetical protein
LELGRAGVENERLPTRELVIEEAGQPGIPSLGHSSRMPSRGLFRRIEVDVEVLGLEHLEIEALVLDFVATEVLGVKR